MAEQLTLIPVKEILADEQFNCRGRISPLDVKGIADSIKENGLDQPIIVTPIPENLKLEPGNERYNYRLIAGFRRLLAHKMIEAAMIKAIIRDDVRDERSALLINLRENVERSQLDIVEEAQTIERLQRLGITSRQELAKQLGQSDGWVQVRVMLLELPNEVLAQAKAGIVRQSDIRDLYSVHKTVGPKATLHALGRVMDARAAGKAPRIKKESELKSKKIRGRHELNEMQDYIRDILGNGPMTRLIAWATGIISTEEWLHDLKSIIEEKGGLFTLPDFLKNVGAEELKEKP